jgi:hypothetical protein
MTDALAINPGAPCWLAATKWRHQGYAAKMIHGEVVGLHRYMWEQLRGPIPAGMHIHHICGVRHCLNPQHMMVVTPGEHLHLGVTPAALNKLKTHCNHGHEFTPENTYWRPTGGRTCKECGRNNQREYKRIESGYYSRHPRWFPDAE